MSNRLSKAFADQTIYIMGLKNISQKDLANKMNVSEQRISIILSGEENLSLKTISAIEIALDHQISYFPDFKYNKPEHYTQLMHIG